MRALLSTYCAPLALLCSLEPMAAAAAEPYPVRYVLASKQSFIPVATAQLEDPSGTDTWRLPYSMPRTYGFGDFNGDGSVDIVVAPTYFNARPERRVEFWLNTGDGSFSNGTDSLLKGASVFTGVVNVVEVRDFNEDGRVDVLLIDQGLEVDAPTYPGHRLGLLLSQPDGAFVDASDRISPNEPAFNHNGGVGDLNSDGHLDFVVARLGVPGVHPADGTVFFLGDGKGNFTASTSQLPPEVAFLSWDKVDYSRNRQNIGCVVPAHLDDDGRVDLVTGTYNYRDELTGKRTVRFFQQQRDGALIEKTRIEIPDAIRDVGYYGDSRTNESDGLGCASITVGALTDSGRQDVIVLWEGWGKSYIEILRNDGNFQFADVTLEAFGTYNTTHPGSQSAANYRLIDVNGDGFRDIVFRSFGEDAARLAGGSFIFLNDRAGRFARWIPRDVSGAGMTADHIASTTGCSWCNFVPLVFDANRDHREDVVLIDHQSFVTTPPVQTYAVQLSVMLSQWDNRRRRAARR